MHPIFVTIDRFLNDLQPKHILRQTDRQTNFKLSGGNTFNNGTNGKKGFFEKKILKIGAFVQKLSMNKYLISTNFCW